MVLMKYVTAKMFTEKEDCMPQLSGMFEVVGWKMVVSRAVHRVLGVAGSRLDSYHYFVIFNEFKLIQIK